ncbi:MAG: ATP-binding domain-containing protein, partial [Bacteroidales bacterium]
SQYLIVKKLSMIHKNVCVVGDDAQSIYSFRGAKIENILNFKNDYAKYRLFKLERNYRSTKTIVSAANSIIAKNKEQIHKKIWSDNDTGEKIKIIRILTDTEEGFYVSNSILDTALSEQEQYSEFAVLYRTNAQSRIFEEALRKRNIPYKVYGSISFYERKEIKDALAYLRLTVNQYDNEALKRIINYPARGLGKVTLGKLEDQANKNGKSIWEIILKLDKENSGFNSGILARLKSFESIISDFSSKLESHNAYELARYILANTGILKDLYDGDTPDEISKYENIEELLNGIREFTEENKEDITLDKYLQNVSLLTDMDNEKKEDRNKVTIMTIHSAKGLEFNNIYIAGVEEDLLPSRLSLDSPKDLEEERRLFYVAVTRARKRVILTYAQSRYRWGSPVDCSPSRFIKDIDEKYVDHAQEKESVTGITNYEDHIRDADTHKLSSKQLRGEYRNNHINAGNRRFVKLTDSAVFNNSKSENADRNFKSDDPEKIQSGMKVEHQRFGVGKVVHIEGVFPNRKATVLFHESGQKKQLLLKFAKLKIVSSL